MLLMLAVRPGQASEGDRSPEYQKCVDSCNLDSCLVGPTWDDGMAKATRLPLMLKLTFWSCLDDCRYHCTHRVTNEAHERVTHIRLAAQEEIQRQAESNHWSRAEQRRRIDESVRHSLDSLRRVQKQMVQYHGKWVFIRMFGAQEPLSVLFSVANLSVHLNALDLLRRQVPDGFPLKAIYILHALLSCVAWFWSAVFHTRDKILTERLDYFGAGGVVLGALFLTTCRVWRLAPGSIAFVVLARLFASAYAMHLLYLSVGRFDYGYNMKANVFVGVTNSLLWLVYSFLPEIFSQYAVADGPIGRLRVAPHVAGTGSSSHASSNPGSPPVPVSTPAAQPPSSSRKARQQLRLILGLLWLASSLEIFDFAPVWRALDAHALWHLATVPIARMWYAWLIEDARECTSTGFWIGSPVETTKLAEYLQLPHKTEVAVESVTRAVGPPVRRAVECAREWVGASRRSSNDDGQSSGIEFKALTTKLNEIARSTLGTGVVSSSLTSQGPDEITVAPVNGLHPTSAAATAHARTASAVHHHHQQQTTKARVPQSDREREKLREMDSRVNGFV